MKETVMDIIAPVALATAAVGDTINKSTTISISLVIVIVAATLYVSNIASLMQSDIKILQSDVDEIKTLLMEKN